MKVLWLTVDIPQFDYKSKQNYNGGGWIKSLLDQITTRYPEIQIGYAFPYDETSEIKNKQNILYFPLKKNIENKFLKLLSYWRLRNTNDYFLCQEPLINTIKSFKPDIIHVFGIEHGLASVVELTNIPVVIHLQGLLIPYNNAFYPIGINKYSFYFKGSFIHECIFRNGFNFRKWSFGKNAQYEQRRFMYSHFVMGRTEWDYQISKLYSPNSQYFHVDECLRSTFYEQSSFIRMSKLILFSTLSETVYKGLDVVLKTAYILKNILHLDFEWKIAGIKENTSFVHMFEKEYNIESRNVNLQYLGILNADELKVQLYNSSIFIHPSYIDNSPNSVCEAQISGLPVIACNVGGLNSLIENKQDGILVPANAPNEMAFWIDKLWTDKDFYNQISIQGRKRALRRHDRNQICKELINAYMEIIKLSENANS